MFCMKILKVTYMQIMNSYDSVPPECGGIIGGENGIINTYYHDKLCGITDRAIYEPNAEQLNQVIHDWNESRITFYGMLHSHPEHETMLSDNDISYIKSWLPSLPNGTILYFPIVLPKQTIIPYLVKFNDGQITILKEKLEICSR